MFFLWKTHVRSYDGTDEVYVRVVQAGGGSSVQICNMYILNEGENSKTLKAQYDEEYAAQATGINELSTNGQTAGKVYNLNGQQVQAPVKGLFIMDGKKVVLK